MDKLDFNSFVSEGIDIFGFDKRFVPPDEETSPDPIEPLDSDMIIEYLSKNDLNVKKAKEPWPNEVQWGEGVGAVRVDISPLGSYKVIARRLHTDLEGNYHWICKQVIPLIENEKNRNENSMAIDIHEKLCAIDRLPMDSPDSNFDIRKLVIRLAENVRRYTPKIFFYEGVRQVDENTYIIHLGVDGHGLEGPGGMRIEQFHITTSYYPKRGVYRVIMAEIQSPTRQHLWYSAPSEFDEHFMPTQPADEIISAVVSALGTY